jgi:hypothetical protein
MRLLAALVALSSLYYLRFFLFVRSEPTTLLQIGLLLCAAAVLTQPPLAAGPTLTDGRAPGGHAAGRLLAIAAASLLALFVFLLADRDSHSASDTLTRVVPAYCLIFASAAWLLRHAPAPARD